MDCRPGSMSPGIFNNRDPHPNSTRGEMGAASRARFDPHRDDNFLDSPAYKFYPRKLNLGHQRKPSPKLSSTSQIPVLGWLCRDALPQHIRRIDPRFVRHDHDRQFIPVTFSCARYKTFIGRAQNLHSAFLPPGSGSWSCVEEGNRFTKGGWLLDQLIEDARRPNPPVLKRDGDKVRTYNFFLGTI
jgi:hypothetical protein